MLYVFTGQSGSYSLDGLIETNGHYYGTTTIGGTYNDGAVFELAPGGTDYCDTAAENIRPSRAQKLGGRHGVELGIEHRGGAQDGQRARSVRSAHKLRRGLVAPIAQQRQVGIATPASG